LNKKKNFFFKFQDITYKLENLKVDDSNPLPVSSRQSINRILSELKDQERLNEAALEILKKRIIKESSSPTRSAAFMSNQTQNLNTKRSPVLSNTYSKPIPQQQFRSSSAYLSKPYAMLDDSLSPEEIR
jgi:hypothetical protein